MPGSSVNQAFQPQWRSHYLDQTGFICMGTRYYDPQAGRFISPDPLGHSSSLGLYDYCNGDPVNGLDPDGRCVEKTEAAAAYLGNKYVNYSMSKIGRQWDESESINNNFSNGNYSTALQQYAARVGPSLLATIVPEGKPIGAALEGAYYYLAQENTSVIEEAASSMFPAGYQGGPGAMWREEKLIAEQKAIVIGEGMEDVINTAKQLQTEGINATWYKAWNKNFNYENFNLGKSLQRNERWIRSKIKNGSIFYDIGIDPLQTRRSLFYQLEKKIFEENNIFSIPLTRP